MRSSDPAQRNPPSLKLNLFGGVVIYVDGRRITDLATRKAEALLIYLVCQPHPHQRETLAELLWDDLPADRAAGNLRLTLNQLGKRFADFLDTTRQTIALRQNAQYELDVQIFADTLTTESDDLETIAEALSVYRGDFLQGFHLRDARGFSEWQAAQAQYWKQQALIQMRWLADAYTAHSNYTRAIEWVARILVIDPVDEVAHRQMMLLLARSGQRAAAVRQYRTCQQIVQQELGLDPEPATDMLYQRISRMSTQRPHSLPGSPRALLGRSTELARIYSWLATPAARLMSIVGPGGSGKSHLALTIGWRAVSEYLGPCSDGVFYIPLIAHDDATAPVDDAGVLIAIAASLRIRLVGTHDLLDQLIQQIRDKEVLLIVDNGELLGAGARRALGALVQQTQAVRVLVPSRERLKLREEHVLDVQGLAYPVLPARIVTKQQEQRFQDALGQYASVQLLLECARQVQGAADLSAFDLQNQLAIGKICQIVNGLPLAIELVAPWLRLRSPVEVADEIAQAIDLLTTDMPDVPARHRSMRAVFEYSWQLIDDAERVALAHLSIFPASFTAEAALVITSVTLPHLAALRDRSLIQSSADSRTRYALHPLLRHLAHEKLQSDPAAAAALQVSHARYFATFVSAYEHQLRSAEGPAILKTLAAEMDNLRAGWQWAVTVHDLTTLGQYSIPLHDFCVICGWELEGRHLFRMAAAVVRAWVAQTDSPKSLLLAGARVLSCYGELQYVLGELDAAEAALHDGRAILSVQTIEDAPELIFIYKHLGLLAYRRGIYADALRYNQLSLQMAEQRADDHKCADALLTIGAVAHAQGDWMYATQVFQRCRMLYHALEFDWGIGHSLRFLGIVALAQGDRHAARHYYEQSLALAQQIGNRIGEALVYDQLGLLYLTEHELDLSASVLEQGMTIFQEIGVDVGIARTLCHLGWVALARADSQAARQYLRQSILIAQRLQAPPVLIESLASALHWRLHPPRHISEEPPPHLLLWSLSEHPACAADTREYITSLLSDINSTYASGRSTGEPPWPLEQVLAYVTMWLAGTASDGRSDTL